MANKSPYFDKILCIDVETSGMNFDTHDVSEDYQIVSIALLVADTQTFTEIDSLYLEIKWNGKSKWNWKAEQIHGLTKEYLEENGISEEDAVEQISLFIYKYFGIDNALSLLGHNVVHFDLQFLRGLLHRHGLNFKFAHRHVDSFALSMPTLGAFSSDELFEMMGFDKREDHNALEDIRMTLKSVRIISKMWKKQYAKEPREN